jgi:RNA polymerase-associated protein LEO1
MIGQECFDVVTKSMNGQEYTFLLAHQTSSGVLESHTQFTDHMTFQPSDVHSLTHRHLTAHIAGKHVKKTRTKMFFTEMDPEKQKQELEAQENERLRAARKLDSQRRRTELQFDDSGRLNNYDYGDDEDVGGRRARSAGAGAHDDTRGARGGGYVGRGDAYDDDFVVDDEEYDEEEERAREQRLSQLKGSGMERYQRRDDDDEEEEEEEEEEDFDDDDDDEIVVRRPKKRHVETDDDEDDD